MQKRKGLIIGLIMTAALAAVPYCTDYGNDGWRILGWHTGVTVKMAKAKIPNRYVDATNERLRFLGFDAHEEQAIYELGRRGARELEPQLRKTAEAPPWKAGILKRDFHQVPQYACRIAALAVLAKWKVAGAEEDLLHGFSVMPELEHSFVPALAYVNSDQTVHQIKLLKGYKIGVWKCSRASNEELACAWTGLQY